MLRSEQSGGERELMRRVLLEEKIRRVLLEEKIRRVLLEEKIRLGRNASWSEKGGGFPKISKLRSYTVL